MGFMASQITSNSTICSTAFQPNIRENPHHWPFVRESTGDRWIPLTKGQWCGERFHVMTSSCDALCLGLFTGSLDGVFHDEFILDFSHLGDALLSVHLVHATIQEPIQGGDPKFRVIFRQRHVMTADLRKTTPFLKARGRLALSFEIIISQTLQWRHMSGMVSQITGKSSVQQLVSANTKGSKTLHYWPFVRCVGNPSVIGSVTPVTGGFPSKGLYAMATCLSKTLSFQKTRDSFGKAPV